LKNKIEMTIENLNPSVYQKIEERKLSQIDFDNNVIDEIDEREIFDCIRSIQDPEHPLTLEELNVLDIESVSIDHKNSVCHVQFTPTIPHCS
jgi:metal-sulfur cluster biosynthetic enzyme